MSRRPPDEAPPRSEWMPERDAVLFDAIADGKTFEVAGGLLGVSKAAAVGRFDRVRCAMGWQAR